MLDGKDATGNFLWRARYTIYGQRKTGWGWRLWWEWSAVSLEDRMPDDTPQYMAEQEIYAAMT